LIEKSNKNYVRSNHLGASSYDTVLANYPEKDPLTQKNSESVDKMLNSTNNIEVILISRPISRRKML
jgi:hypothetical protein